MRRLAAGLVALSGLSAPLPAQERDRSLERISLALQQPPPVISGAGPGETRAGAVKLGPFTLETPQLRGEIIRLSLPVGEYITRLARGIASANRRRQEAAARRQVEAELEALARRQPAQKK